MNFEFIKKNYHITTFILLYFSLIIGFLFGENTTLGPKFDFEHALKQVQLFEENFFHTLLNYDNIIYPTRISPIFIIIILYLKKIFINIDLVRFILLNIIVLNQIYFYKCLKLIFLNKNKFLDKKNLFLLSTILLLSPSFRSNAIWPESAMLGLLFFNISVYYFLKFKLKSAANYIYLNIIFLAIASYIRPSFALFSIFFFIFYFTKLKEHISLLKIVLINLILALPALYYLFVLKIFFISSGVSENMLNFNYLNKFAVIFSIFFFHMLPLLYLKKKSFMIFFEKKNYLVLLTTIIISFISLINFDYNFNNTGGGFFLHLSHLIFKTDLFFLLLIPIFIYFSLKIICINFKDNIILFLILFLITPQFSIYHKYYDPLVFLMAFTIFDFNLEQNIYSKKNIAIIFIFYLLYYLSTLINSNFIKF